MGTNYEIRIGDERWRIDLKRKERGISTNSTNVAGKHRYVER